MDEETTEETTEEAVEETPTDLVEHPDEGTVAQVVEAVGDDAEDAATALRAEEGAEHPRSTLTDSLEATIRHAKEADEVEEADEAEEAAAPGFQPTMTNRVQATMVRAASEGAAERKASIRRAKEMRKAQAVATGQAQPEPEIEEDPEE